MTRKQIMKEKEIIKSLEKLYFKKVKHKPNPRKYTLFVLRVKKLLRELDIKRNKGRL